MLYILIVKRIVSILNVRLINFILSYKILQESLEKEFIMPFINQSILMKYNR
jgi:hypothetical protein